MMTAKDAVGKIATLRRKRCGAQTNLYVLALGLGSSQRLGVGECQDIAYVILR